MQIGPLHSHQDVKFEFLIILLVNSVAFYFRLTLAKEN